MRAMYPTQARGVAVLKLLQATLAHAVESNEFYRERAPVSAHIDNLDDLRRWPICTRDDLALLSELALSGPELPQYVGLTSGTGAAGRRDRPILFRIASEDQRHVRQTLMDAIAGAGPKTLSIRFITDSHGLDFTGPRAGVFALPLAARLHMSAAITLLRKRFAFSGYSAHIEHISGPVNLVYAFTTLLKEAAIEPSEFHIKALACWGDRLGRDIREGIETYWNAPVTDIFGLSEAPGVAAIGCPECGGLHFLPTAHIEILEMEANNPVKAGAPGRLIVTSFYPLARLIPVIRYDTGDFLCDNGWCANGERSFRFVARNEDVVWLPVHGERSLFVSARAIEEAIRCLPGARREQDDRLNYLGLRTKLGKPKYRILETGHDSLEVGYDAGIEAARNTESERQCTLEGYDSHGPRPVTLRLRPLIGDVI